ncbi:MAG: hypothetical protein OXF88_02140 [Rhodobacteraceae bacterium]|nr:hypothetical protein [Paracoccaceae bacterium]MCY4137758.1 hypothetical protein [Paracoccaceae bacterium]
MQFFKRVVILGDGFAAKVAVLALAEQYPVSVITRPGWASAIDVASPANATGHSAHSHIFLPRLEYELAKITPRLLDRLHAEGLSFIKGSRYLFGKIPIGALRMFATRWQVDTVLNRELKNYRLADELFGKVHSVVIGSGRKKNRISTIGLHGGQFFDVPTDALVLDAMGTNSPIMTQLQARNPGRIDEHTELAYLTLFSRLKINCEQQLPDALTECTADFRGAFVTLYQGANRWFSLTVGTNIRNRELIRAVRNKDVFVDLCSRKPELRAWIDASEPIGEVRFYHNPRNRWNLGIFEDGTIPLNYSAIGDSLVTTCPSLGAGCSFAATHVRATIDNLHKPIGEFHVGYAKEIKNEQFAFFAESQKKPPPPICSPCELDMSVESYPRLLARRIRRAAGLERRRTIRRLSQSSSLPEKLQELPVW